MNDDLKKYDLIVLGGGHAGIEASWLASQFKLQVALITMKDVPLGETPCNPAVGGVGKGQVVREIDALGGLMGRVTDLAGIHYRTLNESKGFAVQSTRVQVDKRRYSSCAKEILEGNEFIDLIYDKIYEVDILINGENSKNCKRSDQKFHIKGKSGEKYSCRKLIVTMGTFLDGKLHIGAEITAGGMLGYDSAPKMANIFKKIRSLPYKFMTGTPPRLEKESIQFEKFEKQPSDCSSRTFHYDFSSEKRLNRQISCYLTKTNENTLSIIRKNRDRSPLFNGQIQGVGPRYCPSIEDKAFRYPDRDTHHIFLEPEGLDLDTIYPNGLSTSLPKDVQISFINSIIGLEEAKIINFGYGVEYDVVDTTFLDQTLEHQEISGLYFAGQVNGTSGYEEAAGQGVIAGINAAISICGNNSEKKVILDRYESYIGVMIEDLVTNKRDEPYRLFTARAENRLYVREDNAINRMRPYRQSLGLSEKIDDYQSRYMEEFVLLEQLIESNCYYNDKETREYFFKMGYGEIDKNITLAELMKRSKLNPIIVLENETLRHGTIFMEDVLRAVAISTKYEGYITRAMNETVKIRKLGKKRINWENLINSPNISTECRSRIKSIRPSTFSELQRIEGIRPATVAYVAGSHL